MYLFLAAVTLVTLFPLIWIVMQSFKSSREIVSAPLALPTQWSIQGYVDAFEMAPILTFYKNSILVTVFSMALTVVFYSMAAYALSRIRSKAAALLVGLVQGMVLVHRDLGQILQCDAEEKIPFPAG